MGEFGPLLIPSGAGVELCLADTARSFPIAATLGRELMGLLQTDPGAAPMQRSVCPWGMVLGFVRRRSPLGVCALWGWL